MCLILHFSRRHRLVHLRSDLHIMKAGGPNKMAATSKNPEPGDRLIRTEDFNGSNVAYVHTR